MNRNVAQKFWVLKGGPNAADGYNTLKQAEDDGAVTMAYG
jgi:large conductance mechanosensitive channel